MSYNLDWLMGWYTIFCKGPDLPGFLLQPFRKPKRIRTAFSPSQLLKLEHAFERNHYVVGAERKQLASSLSLSETQVSQVKQNMRNDKFMSCLFHLFCSGVINLINLLVSNYTRKIERCSDIRTIHVVNL